MWLRYGGPGFTVYGRSKLYNILFTRELSRRLHGTCVTANCCNPGFTATNFGTKAGGLMGFGIGVAKRFARSLTKGSEALVYLASSPQIAEVTGEYFHDQVPVQPSKVALHDAAGKLLWQESLRLSGTPEE